MAKSKVIEGATVELGDRVQERITTLSGIAIGIIHWLNKCTRVVVQPEGLTKDGQMWESETFDIELLDVVEKNAVVVKKEFPTGGPKDSKQERAALRR